MKDKTAWQLYCDAHQDKNVVQNLYGFIALTFKIMFSVIVPIYVLSKVGGFFNTPGPSMTRAVLYLAITIIMAVYMKGLCNELNGETKTRKTVTKWVIKRLEKNV